MTTKQQPLWNDADIEKHIDRSRGARDRDWNQYEVFLWLRSMRDNYEAERTRLMQRVAELEREADALAQGYREILAELEQQAGQRWEPVEDGLYLDGALAIAYNGKDIGLKIDDEEYAQDDWANNYQWLSDCEIHDYRAKEENYRLCRLVASGPQANEQPAAQPAPVPPRQGTGNEQMTYSPNLAIDDLKALIFQCKRLIVFLQSYCNHANDPFAYAPVDTKEAEIAWRTANDIQMVVQAHLDVPATTEPEIMQTIRQALRFHRLNAEGEYLYGNPDEDRVSQINAALSWLDTMSQATPQPDWSQAPEWAQWWAVDPNGWAHWFQEEPILALTIYYCGWIAKTVNGIQIGAELWAAEYDLALGIDWRLLKQQRPTPQEVNNA